MVSAYHFTPVSKTRGAPPASAWEVPRPQGAALSAYAAGYLAARAVSPEVANAAGMRTAQRAGETPAAFADHRRRSTPCLVVSHPSPDAPVSRLVFRTGKGKDLAGRIEIERGLAWETVPSRCRRRGARGVVGARGGPPDAIRAIGSGPTHLVRGEGDR